MRFVTSIALTVIGSLGAATQPAHGEAPDPNAAANAFFERAFQERLELDPTLATSLGLRLHYGEWGDPSERGDLERFELAKNQLAELRASIDPAALDAATRLSYRVFESSEERRIGRYRWRNHSYQIDKDGPQVQVPAFLINAHRIDTESDALAYIQRLVGLQSYMNTVLERAELAARGGVLPPKFVYAYVIEDAGNVIKGRPFDDGPADSPLFADFKAKVGAIGLDDKRREELTAQAADALLTSVKPAWASVIAWAKTAEPRATTDDGIWKLPDGGAYYDFLLENFTTTKLSATQIHDIGLREVARLHGEMRRVMREVGFAGDLQAFFNFMRTDDRFYYPDTPEGQAAWLADATRTIEAMRARLPELFVTLPKAELVVRAVEPFREKSAGKAFYQRPAQDGSRPGVFYANLYHMREMPKYEQEALAFHEGIPGHHMQIAVASEQEALPQFRRSGGFTAYSEGWGLYSERLGKELGFYRDPYSEFGRLALELHRAVRLVVDTGLHAKRWSREQTIRYHIENSPTGEDAAAKATERYILNPGQATAYMIGMLKIVELRERAAAALGKDFDIREFHDLMLRTGGVPLTVLESEAQRWIDARRG
ncbi:MAG: DUF885 domain-containing protein [Gammaproteobacteria bacterium]|nr:DUF885 domain-containing protein [Gammaproteobacteria bacterium]